MAYEMVMPYHLHMPSYFLKTFTEYPKVMSRGFNGYLSKPLNKDELLKMLHKMGI